MGSLVDIAECIINFIFVFLGPNTVAIVLVDYGPSCFNFVRIITTFGHFEFVLDFQPPMGSTVGFPGINFCSSKAFVYQISWLPFVWSTLVLWSPCS